jgi:hypothetical protein
MDTPLLLVAASTWRHGGNPYDTAALAATFKAEWPAGIEATLRRGQQAFVYSPAAYAILSPITWLPWSAQRLTWNLLNIFGYLSALALICRLAAIPVMSLQGAAVFAIGLASDPGHICIALGQTGVLTLWLMSLSWSRASTPGASTKGATWRAGVLGAAALLIKPQIALVFLACEVYLRRTAVAAIAAATAAAALVAAIFWHGDVVALLTSWLNNMHALMLADADPLFGSLPHQLINLQSPLAVLTGDRKAGTALTFMVCGALTLGYFLVDRKRLAAPSTDLRRLEILSAASVLMLLLFYHRLYDAVFLIVPAALAVKLINSGDRRGWALLGFFMPLWIPLSSIVYRISNPATGFTGGPIFQAIVVQHQTWFLLAALILLIEIRRRPTQLHAAQLAPVSPNVHAPA